jgi:hypothetical protein
MHPALFASDITTRLSDLMLSSPQKLLLYAGGVVFLIAVLVYCLWTLAVYARFIKPIELSAACPACGSKDFRPSYEVSLDRIGKKLGIFPYRCRGCTKRFFRRSLHGGPDGFPGEAGY